MNKDIPRKINVGKMSQALFGGDLLRATRETISKNKPLKQKNEMV